MVRLIRTARPRLGLLGNPSDGYGGKVLACTFEDFAVSVAVEDSERVVLAGPRHRRDAAGWDGLLPDLTRLDGGLALLLAAWRRFDDYCAALLPPARRPRHTPLAIRFESNVPRQAGLAGSSAIVIATLRALMARFEVAIEPATMAELALAAETEDLGITAGPQDRVVQAYEGLLHMDFAPPRSADRYRRLDPALLPPLFVAWNPEVGTSSGTVHDDVRRRFEHGDPLVVSAMERFPLLAERGVACLRAGDRRGFMRLVNENFDLRASIWQLRKSDQELVEVGRRAGAAVKFCGSGGAVVGVLAEDADYPHVAAHYRAAGFPTLRPRITRPRKLVS